MSRLAITIGLALILLGLAFFLTTHASTALIPSAVGLLLIIPGILAAREKLRMHAMHGALTIALLGLIATIPGTIAFFRWILGQDIPRPAAAAEKFAMAFLLLLFLVFGLRTFIKIRLERARRNTATPQ